MISTDQRLDQIPYATMDRICLNHLLQKNHPNVGEIFQEHGVLLGFGSSDWVATFSKLTDTKSPETN